MAEWYEKCHELSISGNLNYSKYGINDFANSDDSKDFIKCFEKNFEIPTKYLEGFYGDLAKARWDMCKALQNKDIEKVAQIGKDNNVEHFSYGASPAADYVYGSNFMDCYLLLATYEYILDGNLIIRKNIFNAIARIDDRFDWFKNYVDLVHKLEKEIPGHK